MAVSRVDVEVLETRLLYSADLLPFGDDVAGDSDDARVFPLVVGDGSTTESSYTVPANGLIVVTDFQAESGLDRWVLLDAPTHGFVELNGSVVNTGETVTATQVQNGEVSYVSNVGGGTATSDTLRFQQADGTGTQDNYVRWNLSINHPPAVGDDVVLLPTSGVSSGSITVAQILANDADPNGDGLAITGFSSPGNGALERASEDTLTYTQTSGAVTGNFQDTATVSVREIDSSYLVGVPLITNLRDVVNDQGPVSGGATLTNSSDGAFFSASVNGLDYGAIDLPDAFLIEVEIYPTDVEDDGDDIIFSIGAAADVGSITLYTDEFGGQAYLIAHMGGDGNLPSDTSELNSGPHMYMEIDGSFEHAWHTVAVAVDDGGQASLIVDGVVEDTMNVSGIDYRGGDFRVGNDIFLGIIQRPFDGQIRNLFARDITGLGTIDPNETTVTSNLFFRR
ncbi:MAG: Ig-like domain-containing protein, partial [Pseudomonadota bacterium]